MFRVGALDSNGLGQTSEGLAESGIGFQGLDRQLGILLQEQIMNANIDFHALFVDLTLALGAVPQGGGRQIVLLVWTFSGALRWSAVGKQEEPRVVVQFFP